MELPQGETHQTKEYKGYSGLYYQDTETGQYFGRVTLPSDVVTFRASDHASAQKEFEASVDDYLEMTE